MCFCLCVCPCDCLCQCQCESLCMCGGSVFPSVSVFDCVSTWLVHPTATWQGSAGTSGRKWVEALSPCLAEVQCIWRVWVAAVLRRRPRLTNGKPGSEADMRRGSETVRRLQDENSGKPRDVVISTPKRQGGAALLMLWNSVLRCICWNTKIHTRFTVVYDAMSLKFVNAYVWSRKISFGWPPCHPKERVVIPPHFGCNQIYRVFHDFRA